MSRGTIALKPLYELLKKEGNNVGLLLQLSGRQAPGHAYTSACRMIATPSIPDEQGFYLWGYYNRKRLWKNIYLGKAGLGKGASLRKRILEELKDERCFAFRPFKTEDELHKIRIRIHKGKYENHWKRALLKAATTHIIWVTVPHIENEDLIRIEADLIEALNPTANLMRPSPPAGVWQQDTQKIFGLLRKEIHKHRGDVFDLELKI